MSRTKALIFSLVIVFFAMALWPVPDVQPVKYVERATGEIKTEKIEGEGWLKWLYYNPVGELTLNAMVKRKFVSDLYGKLMDKPSSTEKIEPFVRKYDIDMNIVKKQKFDSFNDFFTRELKPGARPVDPDPNTIVSPADGKILVFENIENKDFFVKGYRFNLAEFLNDNSLAERYKTGVLMIIRLAPPDYHRFHFPVNGNLSGPVKVKGDYYSVSPLALRKIAEIFCMNKREYLTISTSEFGEVVMAEVGATMVGSIIQTYKGKTAKKGVEKGLFKFGGSTVILIFEPGKIVVDDDLLKNSASNLETTVKAGERIAVKTGN